MDRIIAYGILLIVTIVCSVITISNIIAINKSAREIDRIVNRTKRKQWNWWE